MPKLVVENVPGEIYECLQRRAAARQRSVSDETLTLLGEVLADDLRRKGVARGAGPNGPNAVRQQMAVGVTIVMLLAVVTIGIVVLRRGPRNDARPEMPPGKVVEYVSGFFAEEQHQESGSRWRWMGEEGVVDLRNTRQPMILRIVGRVSKDLPEPATITIELNGKKLEGYPGPSKNETKEYTISPEQQGPGEYSQLRIHTSKTVVPREVDKTSRDDRKLGFKLYELSWTREDEKK